MIVLALLSFAEAEEEEELIVHLIAAETEVVMEVEDVKG